MRLLDRYLLRELLIPLGFCLCGFLIFWIAFDLFGSIGDYQSKGLFIGDVAEIYIVRIPEFLVTILPIVLLLALLYTLTNHARHNELTAIRAAGVSLWRICVGYLVVGLVLSLVLFALNELWVPNSAEMAERIMQRRTPTKMGAFDKDVQTKLGLKNGRDGRTWFVESYNLRTHVMTGPQVDWTLPDGSRCRVIARHAEYRDGMWTFGDAQEYRSAPGGGSDSVLVMQTNSLVMPEFSETPDEFKRENDFNNRLARLPRGQSPEIPVSELLDYLRLHPDQSKAGRERLYTQLFGRLATPWTCLVVVVIAIPFGAASGRRNVFVGVASSIVICFAFYVLQRVCLAMGIGGALPPFLAAWLPNLSFGIAGLWMMARVR
jgi:lipopolysaccharide export system permease protein